MGEVVTVERSEDLMPWDMIEEGRTIISLQWGAGSHIETARVRLECEAVGDGRCLRRPVIEDVAYEPFPSFPVRVLRPAPMPAPGCELCRPAVTDVRRSDG